MRHTDVQRTRMKQEESVTLRQDVSWDRDD